MEETQRGLRRRLERGQRHVATQHEQLREIAAELDRARDGGSFADVDLWLERLRDSLAAHFELEQNVLFPALESLAPPTGPALAALVADHRDFLETLRSLLAGGAASEGADAALSALRARLATHERAEEELLQRSLA